MRRARPLPHALVALVALGAVVTAAPVALSGCRREATEADCQLIVDRLVEVELRAMKTTDPAAIAKKQEAIRGGMKDELRDCKGRRVSDKMLACVKKAETTDEILGCIR